MTLQTGIRQSDGATVRIETDCIITHEGHSFESGGALIAPDHAIGYPDGHGRMTTWHGETIGTYLVTSSWPVNSVFGNRMYQIKAHIDGHVYTGRGLGAGMIWRGKAKKT